MTPIETSTVLLGLRLLELCREEFVTSDMGVGHVLDRPEFRDYDPTLRTSEIPALRDRINCVIHVDER